MALGYAPPIFVARQVIEKYELGPHHLHLLRLCCEALDHGTRLDQRLQAVGGGRALAFARPDQWDIAA